MSVELFVKSSAWQAASRPTLRLILVIYTVATFHCILLRRNMSEGRNRETLHLRGARSFVQGRFESVAREDFDDGGTPEEKPQGELKTQVAIERARSIVSHNDSPDVGFDRSINPY